MGWFGHKKPVKPQAVRALELWSLIEAKVALDRAEGKIQEYRRLVELEMEAVNAREREARTESS